MHKSPASRWVRWAGQLRARHAHRPLLPASLPGMVLPRAGRRPAGLRRSGGLALSLSLHFGVTMPVRRNVILSRTWHLADEPAAMPVFVSRRADAPFSQQAGVRPAAGSDPRQTFRGGLVVSYPFVRPRPAPRSAAESELPRFTPLTDLARGWAAKPAPAAQAAEFLQRTRSRSKRQETPAPESSAVLRRRTEAEQTETATAVRPAPAPGDAWRATFSPVQGAPPSVNVEALTSQVIQQLDRRLVAYRERMGRG